MSDARTFGRGVLRAPLAVAAVLAAAFQGCHLVTYEHELMSIAVTPSSTTIALVTTQQLTATGSYSDDTEADVTGEATWVSSDPAVVSVSSDGLATPVGGGTAVVTASMGGVAGSATVTVTDAQLQAIEVTPANPAIANGTRVQLTAIGHFDDDSTQDLTAQVTWTSSEPTVTIGNEPGSNGLAASTALGAASAILTASFDAEIAGSTVLTVNAVSLDSVAVTPATATVTVGQYQQFTATGTFSDASTQDLTREVTWASSDTSVATVTAAGLARGVMASASSVSISATSSELLGSVGGGAQLTVKTTSGGY